VSVLGSSIDAPTLSRRAFLRLTAMSGAALVASSVPFLAGCASTRPRTFAPRARVLADLHCHPQLAAWIEGEPVAVKVPGLAGTADAFLNTTQVTWDACYRSGVDLLCVAHYNPFDEIASMPTDPSTEAPRNLIRMMDALEEHLERPEVARFARLARNPTELGALVSVPKQSPEYRIAVVHTVEGAHALGGSAAPLAELARRGVFAISVTHFFDKGLVSAANAIPYFPDAGSAPALTGLTERGREVIQEMERLGMVVDVTHATREGLDHILKYAKGPLIASHSGARTLGHHPYNLVDEHIQEIARRGGLIGIVLYPYILSNFTQVSDAEANGSLLEVARTVDFVRRLLSGTSGLDRDPHTYIALGTDFGGYIPRIKGMKDLSEVELLRDAIAERLGRDPSLAGHDLEPMLDAIMAENVIAFLKDNWGRSR
jgi:microsomal dipeptidase-like Zn-dependent dipeptidase